MIQDEGYKTPVQKKEEPTKLELLERSLKDAEKVRRGIKAKWEKDRREMRDGRNKSMGDSLRERAKGIKDLKTLVEGKKTFYKAAFDTARTAAIEEYELGVENAKIELSETLSGAKRVKEEGYDKVREELEKKSAPFIQKHKDELAEVERDFADEMKAIDAGERGDIQKLNDKVTDIEVELAKLNPAISVTTAA